MLKLRVRSRVFDVPRVICTVAGNSRAEQVIGTLQGLPPDKKDPHAAAQDYYVFADQTELEAYLRGGVSPNATVVLFDCTGACSVRCFTFMTASRPKDAERMPAWGSGAYWAVELHGGVIRPNRIAGCAQQLRANFRRNFTGNLDKGFLPWGPARKGEKSPALVTLPEGTDAVIARLNDGPDLAAAIAATEHALELPEWSKISWYRVVPEPALLDEGRMLAVTNALRAFQRATRRLLLRRPEVRDIILAGVELADDPRLPDLYLDPPTDCFSIDRPDLHWTGSAVFASEIDEMPGGFPEVAHIDRAYEVNADRWRWCFSWLASKGPVLFLVSHEWSRVYLTETAWLVEYLRSQGYPALMLTTAELDRLEVRADGVFIDGIQVGTVWRQVPVFEMQGKLVDLVVAAKQGLVRLVPEFAYFGNKVLYALFWKHLGFFREELDPADFAILETVLPDSSVVRPGTDSFPFVAAGRHIGSMDELRGLDAEGRDSLVMKVCGANRLAARSYGVLMGHGLSTATWQGWIDEQVCERRPFIVQRRLTTGVERLGVQNTKRGAAEAFDCRILLRPWVVDGKLVSVHGCAVPRETERVHGRVDMAILPVQFGEVA